MATKGKQMEDGRFTKCFDLKRFMGKAQNAAFMRCSIQCTLFLNGFVAAVLLIRFCHIFPELAFRTGQRKIH
jgi:hypothetical protein